MRSPGQVCIAHGFLMTLPHHHCYVSVGAVVSRNAGLGRHCGRTALLGCVPLSATLEDVTKPCETFSPPSAAGTLEWAPSHQGAVVARVNCHHHRGAVIWSPCSRVSAARDVSCSDAQRQPIALETGLGFSSVRKHSSNVAPSWSPRGPPGRPAPDVVAVEQRVLESGTAAL